MSVSCMITLCVHYGCIVYPLRLQPCVTVNAHMVSCVSVTALKTHLFYEAFISVANHHNIGTDYHCRPYITVTFIVIYVLYQFTTIYYYTLTSS